MSKEKTNLGKATREIVFRKTGGKCWYCGETLRIATINEKKGSDIFCIEHMDNLGGDNIDNLYPSCRKCNTLKKDKTLAEFRSWLSAPSFSEKQIEYLKDNNIELPEIKLIKFWGEQ